MYYVVMDVWITEFSYVNYILDFLQNIRWLMKWKQFIGATSSFLNQVEYLNFSKKHMLDLVGSYVGGQTDMHNFEFFIYCVHVKINSFSNLDYNKLWLYFKNIFAYLHNRKCYGWSV